MIEIKNLTKTFKTPDGDFTAIHNISLDIKDGEIFGIIGLSGAGKSTLVRCINLLERPTEGSVTIDGESMTDLAKNELLQKRKSIGMIFQNFNLLEQRNCLGNIMYPLEISGISKNEAKTKAMELLKVVGLSDKAANYPSQLSGGQKQRVAIARALATDPKYILCDEATSALDPNTTQQILELLKIINRERNVTIIVITHEMKVIEQICDRVAVLDNKKLVEIGNVADVFANPQSDMAKEFVLPKRRHISSELTKNAIRIIFDGRSSFEPVLANMILECQCTVNIMYANTKDIGGKAVGEMLLQLPDDEKAVARIRSFLDLRNINYKEENI